MKKQLLTIFLVAIGIIAFSKNKFNPNSPNNIEGAYTINQLDTVFFDLSKKVITGNYIEFPVFIKSDDVINSVDFAVKFDLSKLQYDSLIIHRPSISPIANYNSNDSTLRLTSFDLQVIPNDTLLVSLRFKLLNGTTEIHKTDFNSIAALLNGDPCTGVVIEAGIPSAVKNISDDSYNMNVYPNPSRGFLNINVSENTIVRLLNMEGELVFESLVIAGEKQMINTEKIPDGNYLIQSIANKRTTIRKVTILPVR